MRNILAIDFGTKVIGLAVFKEGNDPFPIGAGRIIVKDDNQTLIELRQMIEDEFINHIVIGIPMYLDGKDSVMTQKVRKFKNLLVSKLSKNITFHEIDESLSTIEAKERMKNSPAFNFKVNIKKIDEVSAVIILETFVNGH